MARKIVINLDTNRECYEPKKCKQNDDLLFEANIFENGVKKDLTNCSIVINAVKPDKTFIIHTKDINKQGNKITTELSRDFTRLWGKTLIEIVLTENNKQNTTFTFFLEVKRSILDGVVTASANVITILEELTDKIRDAIKVKEDTEKVIRDGGAATKGDITNITNILNTKANKLDLWINVADYKQHNTGGNWNGAVTEALKVLHSSTNPCKVLYFPNGTYNIDPNILVLQDDMTVVGASEQKSIIKGNSLNGIGIQCGARCTIKNLTIREFEIGIKNTKHYTKIYNCILSYNTIGVHFLDSYIVKCLENEITFNNIGVLIENQSYELLVKDNVIDNNYLGVGICGSSNGVVISDNTIEGNRNTSAVTVDNPDPITLGCGMLICGTNQSRLEISGNWFESNGTSNESVDVFFSPVYYGNQLIIDMWNKIITQCIPTAYQNKFKDIGVSVGSSSLYNNAHIFTQYGVIVCGGKMNFHISDCHFKGVLDKYNKHILIALKQAHYVSSNINIDNCNANNSDDATIDEQILNGVKKTFISAMEVPVSSDLHNITVNLDGENLFIKKININTLLDGNTYTKKQLTQIQTAGNGSNIAKKGVLDKKYIGNSISGTGSTILLGQYGTSDINQNTITPNVTNGNCFFVIGDKYSSFKYETTDSGWHSVGITYNNKFPIFNINNLKTGKLYCENNNVFYFLIELTKEQMQKDFKGVVYVEIEDMDIQNAI